MLIELKDTGFFPPVESVIQNSKKHTNLAY